MDFDPQPFVRKAQGQTVFPTSPPMLKTESMETSAAHGQCHPALGHCLWKNGTMSSGGRFPLKPTGKQTKKMSQANRIVSCDPACKIDLLDPPIAILMATTKGQLFIHMQWWSIFRMQRWHVLQWCARGGFATLIWPKGKLTNCGLHHKMVKTITFLGIFRGTISFQGFLGGAKWISQPFIVGGLDLFTSGTSVFKF